MNSFSLNARLNKSLQTIFEDDQDLIRPTTGDYDRQYAEDILYHTVGPLTSSPKWVNSEWKSTNPEPEGYQPGGPAYHWTPDDIVYAFAGNPSKLFQGGSDSPNYGRMGGAPMYRAALKIARKFGKGQDKDFISDIYSNGFVPLTRMMKPGFDEGRSAFIPFVMRTVIGAMENGPGAEQVSLDVTADDRAKGKLGLRAAAKSKNPADVRAAAATVKGKYQTERSHDKNPDNPFGQYSSIYYQTMMSYADALESGNQDKIESAQSRISQLVDEIQDANPQIRGASSGLGQAITNKDRGSATGDYHILTRALGIEPLLKDPAKANEAKARYDEIIKKLTALKADNENGTVQEKETASKIMSTTARLLIAYRKKDEREIAAAKRDVIELRQEHLNSKKFGVSSADDRQDDASGSLGDTLVGDNGEDSWIQPEAVKYVLDIALNHDIGKVLPKGSKWLQMAADLGAKDGNIGGKMTVNELRYVIRSLGPLGSNYPGAGKMRSNTNIPRDARGWWNAGEDPEIEPMPNGQGNWNSIWKRQGYPGMQATAISQEMTDEVDEFNKLGIPTARTITEKKDSNGKVKVREALSKIAVQNTYKAAQIKLQVIADIHKEQLGLDESAGLPTTMIDKQIIAEHAEYLANIMQERLIKEAVDNIPNKHSGSLLGNILKSLTMPQRPDNSLANNKRSSSGITKALNYQDQLLKWAKKHSVNGAETAVLESTCRPIREIIGCPVDSERLVKKKTITENVDIRKIKVSSLSQGTILAGSGTKILVGPTIGINTPKGKVDLKVQYRNGDIKWVQWGKNTAVSVIAQDEQLNNKITEGADRSVLSNIYTFTVQAWLDPTIKPENALSELTKDFTTSTPRGITSIKARVIDVSERGVDDIVTIKLKTDLESFIRNSIEYGDDPYEILSIVKRDAGPEAAKAAHEFMVEMADDLKTAEFSNDEEGNVSVDMLGKPNL